MIPHRSLRLLATVALIATACGGSDTLLGADETWVLTEGAVDGQPIVVPDPARITLLATDDGIGGVAACNSYFGQMTVRGSSVTFGQLGQTEMACVPVLMQAEAAYLGGLGRVATGTRDGDVLELTGPDVTLRFTLEPPVETAALVGTPWLLDGLVDGDAVSSVSSDMTDAELVFEHGGALHGSTGCRRLTGRWQADGDVIVVRELAADGDCSGEAARQDAHVVDVLGGPFRADVEGQRLSLRSAGGLGLEYRVQDAIDG